MVTGLQDQPPDWLNAVPLPTVLQSAVSHWAELQPLAAWDWAREHRLGLDEKAAHTLRTTVFQGIARKHPELLLRLAEEEGIDAPRLLIWKDQTTDETSEGEKPGLEEKTRARDRS